MASEKKTSVISSIVNAICPKCMYPADFDFEKGKWVCCLLSDGCQHEFDWIVNGTKKIWREYEEV